MRGKLQNSVIGSTRDNSFELIFKIFSTNQNRIKTKPKTKLGLTSVIAYNNSIFKIQPRQQAPWLLMISNGFCCLSCQRRIAQHAFDVRASKQFSSLAFHTCNNRSEEHTSELQSRGHLVCRLLLEKKNTLTHSMT